MQKTKVLIFLILSLFFLSSCSLQPKTDYKADKSQDAFKPLIIGNVTVAMIPPNAVITDINYSISGRVSELSQSGSFYVINSWAIGGRFLSDQHYKEAEDKAKVQLSEFLSTQVKSIKSKTTYLSGKNEISVYSSLESALSESELKGSMVLGRYYIDTMSLREYHVLVFYDPVTVLKIIKESKSAVNSLDTEGIDVDDLFTLINEEISKAKD